MLPGSSRRKRKPDLLPQFRQGVLPPFSQQAYAFTVKQQAIGLSPTRTAGARKGYDGAWFAEVPICDAQSRLAAANVPAGRRDGEWVAAQISRG
jgi:hypothetical protein